MQLAFSRGIFSSSFYITQLKSQIATVPLLPLHQSIIDWCLI